MKNVVYKSLVVALVFLLSNVSGAYAAGMCVALARTQSCVIPARLIQEDPPARTDNCCHRKAGTQSACNAKRKATTAQTCPLKYVVGKSLDVFVETNRSKQIEHVVQFFIRTIEPISYAGTWFAPGPQVTSSPPLFITQQNLRI